MFANAAAAAAGRTGGQLESIRIIAVNTLAKLIVGGIKLRGRTQNRDES